MSRRAGIEAGARPSDAKRGVRLTNPDTNANPDADANPDAVRGYPAGEPVRSRTASMPATSRSSA